ncbi:MAG TPA: nickel-dependent lactate racemase [Candidatus Hydrogenedentes bacterium]|nr:nickel-dependent lactate racemase [Candidatus Hydrogenedentota bacterium]
MNSFSIDYGAQTLTATLDWGTSLGAIDIREAPSLHAPERALEESLCRPIGGEGHFLDGIVPGDRVCILVSDAYRKTGIATLLPKLLEALAERGVASESIQFLFASGIHRPPNTAQQREILGADVYDRFGARAWTHDPYDDAAHVLLGTTSRGTPVEINRRAVECDRLIVTGTVVLHYFGGFGGGRKGVVPGVASARTIAHNHAMNLHPSENRLHPDVRIGVTDGNPVAEDMLEAAGMVPVHGIINTVLNRRNDIAGIFVGEMRAAHHEACAFARDLYAVPIARRADFVIASAGPARNYVQSHKALYNAYQAIKPDGTIIFLAPCEEGLGGDHIEKWLRLGTSDDIIAALRVKSEIYGQTALSTREKARQALLLTEMDEAKVRMLGARKADTLSAALDATRRAHGDRATYYVMPSAAYTVPFPAE